MSCPFTSAAATVSQVKSPAQRTITLRLHSAMSTGIRHACGRFSAICMAMSNAALDTRQNRASLCSQNVSWYTCDSTPLVTMTSAQTVGEANLRQTQYMIANEPSMQLMVTSLSSMNVGEIFMNSASVAGQPGGTMLTGWPLKV